MTRWSLRRRRRGTRNAEGEYRPVTAAPVAGRPSTAQPPARQPAAGQAPAGQPGPSSQAGGWFEPGWGRPGQSGSGPYPAAEAGAGSFIQGQPGNDSRGPGQYGPGQPGAGQPGAGQYARSLLSGGQPANGVAVLAPAQQPASVQLPPSAQGLPPVPPGSAPASARDVAAWSRQAEAAEQRSGGAWPDICDQFGLHLLVLAEQLRTSLDELEADEGDPERLRRLYQVDHAVTRMRRASRDLRTLAGRSEEELAGFTTSLLDIIRMALSAIERYTQVTIGRVTDLAVLGYAADDIGSVMAALLDNATRYSPGTVTVSGHLLDDGGVMFRIEDTGIGMGADQVTALNTAFAGPVPEVDERTGRHTGFPVVHRIARKHSIGVRLASRPLPSSGTVAMVTLPPHLLCEVPAEDAQRRPAPATGTPRRNRQRRDRARCPTCRTASRRENTRYSSGSRRSCPTVTSRAQPATCPAGNAPACAATSRGRSRRSPRPCRRRSSRRRPAVPSPTSSARSPWAAVDSPDSADDTETEEEAKP